MNSVYKFLLLNKLRHFHASMVKSFTAWEAYVLERQIPSLLIGSKPQNLPEMPLEVHMLVGARTWLMALWAARSYQLSTGFLWHFVFQDDGTLTQRQIEGLNNLFPLSVVLSRSSVDVKMESLLMKWPSCLKARQKHIMFMKMFDPLFYSEADRFILLDSDVLFFAPPQEILDWSVGERPRFLFNSDTKNSYSIPTNVLENYFGVKILDHVNAGLALIPRAGVNLDMVEEYLVRFEKQSVHDLWLEQTAYALLASKWGGGAALLPDTYEISFGAERQKGCVARHYVGTHDSRPHFFREGVITLARELL